MINNSTKTDEIDILINNIKNTSVLNNLSFTFKNFSSPEDLNKYVSGENWGKDQYPELCFAFSFNKIGVSKYNYSLHYFDALDISQANSDIPNQINPSLNPFQFGPDFKSFQKYTQSGFLYMMTFINNLILNLELGTTDKNITVALGAQKYYVLKSDPFAQFIGFILPFFLVLAYVSPLSILVFRMVSDKVGIFIKQ